MGPRTRMLIALWVLSSIGVAGLITAMAYKPQPQTTTIQKVKPIHHVDRLLKTDKWVKPAVKSAPVKQPEFKARKYWYA